MATKKTSKCLKKAADDEPIFVLRAQDVTAPDTIQHWLHLNQHTLPADKMQGALETIVAMKAWPNRKNPD